MKILLLITGLSMGGAERQVVELASQFASLGHDVMLIAMTGAASVVPAHTAVRLHLLEMKKNPVDVVRGFRLARGLIKKFAPDVVHSHMKHANLCARFLRLFVPMRCQISTSHTSRDGGILWMFAYRWTDGLCDLTTNVSQAAADRFLQAGAVPARKLAVVYNGIDVDRFRFSSAARVELRAQLLSDRDVPVFLAVGRLTVAKDYGNMLQAFKAVSEESRAVLWIVGSGPLIGVLKDVAMSLGISGRVRFLGERSDIPQLMSAADVFVLSSIWEGFGLVVAEAMSCERPVVATDADGVREVLGNCGFLVPVQDSDALRHAMLRALGLDRAAALTMTQAARQHVIDNFSLAAIAEKWLQIYRSSTSTPARTTFRAVVRRRPRL